MNTMAEDSKARLRKSGFGKKAISNFLAKRRFGTQVNIQQWQSNSKKRRQRQSSTNKDKKNRKTLTPGDIMLERLTQGT